MALALWLFSPRAIVIGWGPSHRHPYLATITQYKMKKNYTTLDEKKLAGAWGDFGASEPVWLSPTEYSKSECLFAFQKRRPMHCLYQHQASQGWKTL